MHVWIYYYSTRSKGTNYIYFNLTRGKYNACTKLASTFNSLQTCPPVLEYARNRI